MACCPGSGLRARQFLLNPEHTPPDRGKCTEPESRAHPPGSCCKKRVLGEEPGRWRDGELHVEMARVKISVLFMRRLALAERVAVVVADSKPAGFDYMLRLLPNFVN